MGFSLACPRVQATLAWRPVITALASATVIQQPPSGACSKLAVGGGELWIPWALEASGRVTFDQFCNVPSTVVLCVHKMANICMLVISLQDITTRYCWWSLITLQDIVLLVISLQDLTHLTNVHAGISTVSALDLELLLVTHYRVASSSSI